MRSINDILNVANFDMPFTGRGNMHVRQIREHYPSLELVDRYVSSLFESEKNYKLSTIRTIVFDIRRSFIAANRMRYENDPEFAAAADRFFRTRAPKCGKKAANRIPLTREEGRALCRGPNEKYNVLNRFLLSSGARIHEVAKIKLANIQTVGEHAFITIVGKNRKERCFFVETSLINAIKKSWDSKTYLFEKDAAYGGGKIGRVTISGKVREYAIRILGRSVTPHDFRKLFATMAVKEHPGEIDAVMEFMGNSDYNVFVLHYLQNSLNPRDHLKSIKNLALGA